MEGEQRLGRRPVGAVNEVSPVEAVRQVDQPLAPPCEHGEVFVAVEFGAAKDVAIIERQPIMEGRNLSMILAPLHKPSQNVAKEAS